MSSTATSGNIPYLGSKISLISKAKIRYEGILYTIDPQESTVALAKVRSYGTENRTVENPLPPKDEVYEYIIFRASDIEDLQVSEPPRPTTLHETIPHIDPAIVQHAPPTYSHQSPSMIGPILNQSPRQQPTSVNPVHQQSQIQYRSSQDMSIQAGGGRNYDAGRRRVRTVAPPNIFRQQNTYQSNRNVYRRPGRNMSFAVQPNLNRSPRMRNRSVGGGSSLKFDGDFDFEKANEEFTKIAKQLSSVDLTAANSDNQSSGNKDDQSGAVAGDRSDNDVAKSGTLSSGNVADQDVQKENIDNTENSANADDAAAIDVHFYDRNKSFFDKISCEALEREKGRESRIRKSWQEERHQNAETFGSSSTGWPRSGNSRMNYRQNFYRRNQQYPTSYNNRPMYQNRWIPSYYNSQQQNQQQSSHPPPVYNQQSHYRDSNTHMMDTVPAWYNDMTTPSIPISSYQQRFNVPFNNRRAQYDFRNPTAYAGPRRYSVYG
ncbi:hypothetical protein GJ496_000954 [Pomphorhynchus laevis]|nr:hypothetical protein GJ496_000954 [Pomphorhynchus laevis]